MSTARTGGGPGGGPRRRAGVLAAAAVLGATGGALACTAHLVADADRAAPARIWHGPDEDHRADGPVPRPVPGPGNWLIQPELVGFDPGPDIAGRHHTLRASGGAAPDLMAESAAGLPAGERRAYRRLLGRLDIRETEARSYTLPGDNLTITLHLARLERDGADRQIAAFRSALAGAFSDFPEHPYTVGTEDPDCRQPPAAGKSGLPSLVCTAHHGDLLLFLRADGTGPSTALVEAVGLLVIQLERLGPPDGDA
ncbi:hypothetical protein CUT44_12460 [Streptomyces carminius]|uniref:Sensor domain-containing protein n=1 Tax=Streptomyces carminius TaxID=2665496 RepID=A0A2M8LZU7_9ACTN|nr:hypothetical protein [Streptomyces carminius]PJE97487.1 hypothetical protein CUT44_12460 [Streptomyces carminius]